MQNHIKWLLKEIPGLIESGILDEDSGKRLVDHYGTQEKKEGFNIAFIITGILGAVLVGIGIISIFASNWDEFSRPVRTILSFLPLIIAQVFYGFAFFKKPESIAWTESTSAFLMLMLASSLALISQTYNISGTTQQFVLTWMILSIPLMYLTNSSLVTVFYLVGISYWGFYRGLIEFPGNGIFYWLLLLAALPHLLKNIKAGKTGIRETILAWVSVLTFSFAMAGVMEMEILVKAHLALAVFTLMFYLSGKEINYEGKTLWTRPFQTVALISIFIYLTVMSYEPELGSTTWDEVIYGDRFPSWVAIINWLILLAAAGLSIYLAVNRIRRSEYVNPCVLGFPVLVLLFLLFDLYLGTPLTLYLANLYMLGWGIYYMRNGIRQRQLSIVNAGMLFLCTVVALRFFDPGISFAVKGIVFILLGIGFLFTNYYLSKKLKRKDEEG